MQSFQPALLEGLGRQHTREQVYRAYDRIRSAGWTNVNLDLMFALPGQTEGGMVRGRPRRGPLRWRPDHLLDLLPDV